MNLGSWHSRATVALCAPIVSCGGGSDTTEPPPPPPAPVVTTIEVLPSSRAMLVGDTLTLAATVRDQNGAAMSGVVVSWSSENASVASVSAAGRVTALAAGSSVVSATASGKTGTAMLTVSVRMPSATLEPSTRVSASIGPDGGLLTTTSTAGTIYTLEIPAGALQGTQEVRMTPISDIAHLGLSGGLAGAVDLQPAGLVFALPARLRISLTRAAPAGMRLVGFAANGDFSRRELAFLATSATEAIVVVPHFSSSGAGFGTTAEVSQFTVAPNQSLDGILGQVLAISPNPWDATGVSQATTLAQQAFDQFVLPPLNSAATDAALLAAVSDYLRWRLLLAMIVGNGVFPIVNPQTGLEVLAFPVAFLDRAQAGVDAAADGIRLAIDANATICGTQASLAALRNVLFWQDWASRLNVDVAPNGLDPVTVLGVIQSRCATVVLKNTNMPDSLPANQNFNLDLNVALRFRNGVEQASDFRVDLVGAGVTVTQPGGFTGIGDAISPVGYYTTVINPATSLGFRLRANTCFVASRPAPVPSELCGRFELTRVIYANDFEQGPAGNEWSIDSVTTSPNGKRFHGVLSNVSDTLTVDSIPQHTMLTLEFDLYIIGSWNGNAEDPVAGEPDIIEFLLGGGGSLKKATFSNKPRDNQAFPGDYPGSSFPAMSGSAERGTLGYPSGIDFTGDAVYRITLSFPHTAPSVRLIFNADHNGSIERWGLDNVRVKFGS